MTGYAEVIGDPVAHSKSPLIHGFWLAKLGIDAAYRKCHVRSDDLGDYFAQRRTDPNWRGCNVTIPHKIAVMPHLDNCSPLASQIGAVNAVVRNPDGSLTGGNTDATGFAEPLAGRMFQSVIVLGAGGAARAVLAGISTRRIPQVTILNRNVEKARNLLTEFALQGTAVGLDGEPPLADLLVNSSSLGMTGQPETPHVECHVTDGGLVYDIVYAPLETRLLAASRARGLDVVDGLSMLVAQAAEAFAAFFGQPAPREFDAELRALLSQ
jgi:shikimate dehydrogenase